MSLRSRSHISLVKNQTVVEDSGTFSIHQLGGPPPHLLVLTAAHCFEFITVNHLLYSHLPPSLCALSVVPASVPGKVKVIFRVTVWWRGMEQEREKQVKYIYQAPSLQTNSLSGYKSSSVVLFSTLGCYPAYIKRQRIEKTKTASSPYLSNQQNHWFHYLISYVHVFCHLLYTIMDRGV